MKHNKLTKVFCKIFDDIELGISIVRARKELNEHRQNFRKAPRVARYRNWNLV